VISCVGVCHAFVVMLTSLVVLAITLIVFVCAHVLTGSCAHVWGAVSCGG
jgi:hypothetical protein